MQRADLRERACQLGACSAAKAGESELQRANSIRLGRAVSPPSASLRNAARAWRLRARTRSQQQVHLDLTRAGSF